MVRQIDALMGAYQGAVPGAAVAVLHDGAPVFVRAYGLANLEAGVPATTATNYRLASVTKQFTAAAILLLAEDGRLSIDDAVRKWLPGLPAALDSARIRNLLAHTSGLMDFEDLIAPEQSAPLHDADVLRLLETEQRSYFAPGTGYRYSNSGYVLLGLIIARACGADFAAFLRERIFLPLGMRHTVAYESGISTPLHRAFGYSAVHDSWVRTDQSLTSATLGDGGIYSSVDDLAKWDAALRAGRLLRPESLRLAFQAATGTGDAAVQYGFGWRISGDLRWHSGETQGFRNVILHYLERRTTVIVLTNRNDPEPYATALAIADLVPAG
jgi:CubicO group peptidase (beta-lactamase class C family)